MDVRAELDTPAAAARLFAEVADLAHYPGWLDIVPRAVPTSEHPGEPGPAWMIELRGRFGPLARVKRLRMVRTAHDPPSLVRFERREHDGRSHSLWVLTAEILPVGDASHLRMHLHYGGFLFGPLVERLLGDEIERSKPRLLDRFRPA